LVQPLTETELMTLQQAYADVARTLHESNLEEVLNCFLRSVQAVRLQDTEKYICLVHANAHVLGWSLICQIYRKALAMESEPEGIYATWLSLGLEHFSRQDDNDRSILHDCVNVTAEAVTLYPEHLGFRFMDGLFLFESWLVSGDSDFLDRALNQLKRCALQEQERFSGLSPRTRLYLGHCYFAQGNWSEALEFYKVIDASKLSAGYRQSTFSDINHLISECSSNLNVDNPSA
jgi:hypothetical protein